MQPTLLLSHCAAVACLSFLLSRSVLGMSLQCHYETSNVTNNHHVTACQGKQEPGLTCILQRISFPSAPVSNTVPSPWSVQWLEDFCSERPLSTVALGEEAGGCGLSVSLA